jgi:alpha-N-acetylglucosaminidase
MTMKRRDLIRVLGGGMCAVSSSKLLGVSAEFAASAPERDSNAEGRLATVGAVSSEDKITSSARAVLTRLLGARAKEFDLDWTASEDGHMVYEVVASRGTVSIKGSSGVAICRGAYAYLRQACNTMVTWSGQRLALPAKFPDYARQRVVCPYQFVQYYNVCTFGYSTPFWNWERWQRELDWMALHGVTMPLALDGQEAIWQRVWTAMGLTQAELDRFSTGPAHLPWHRMGNINYFDGALPQGWMDQKRELQKKILTRMRELGMTPIVPAFSGHVPEGFKRVYPQAKTFTLLWGEGFNCTMPRQTKTFFLDPRQNELFKDIGRRFIQEYKKEFGVGEYYLADPFNELKVPVSKEHRYEELAQYGRTIYESIQAGDPDGKWALQGWLFVDVDFWDPKSVKAFLSQVPNDRMLIVDYGNDMDADKAGVTVPREIWKSNQAYFGKPWIYAMAHTFGGNNNVKGNLALIDSRPAEVLASPEKGNLVGWGICPEGIQTNEVVYELMTDIGWSDHKIPLEDWLTDYCRARYGDCPPRMREAWKLLLQSAYSSHSYGSRHAWQMRPTLDPKPLAINAGPVFLQAVEHFIACADQLRSSELYRHDLIEFVCHAVGGSVDQRLAEACEAHKAGKADARDRKAQESFDILLRIDALMNLRKDRRLETWSNEARSWGRNADEAVYYDSNARLLITFWGWCDLEDYASRVWSGLIRDYYVGRWRTFFEGLRSGAPDSLEIWEQAWLSTPYSPSQPQPVTDLVSEARQMFQVCQKREL